MGKAVAHGLAEEKAKVAICARGRDALEAAAEEFRLGTGAEILPIAAKQPVDGLVLSNAVRAGVLGLGKSLANELGPFNILVNNVCPGYTRTDRVVDLARSESLRQNKTVEEIYAVWE